MNVFKYIIGLLPFALKTVEAVGQDLKSGEKKQAAVDIMAAAATGVSAVLPDQAKNASAALEFAVQQIDQTVKLFNTLGVFKNTTKLPGSPVVQERRAE